MGIEQTPSNHNNPLEFLKGKNFVVAETYIIRHPINFSDKTAEEGVTSLLSNQGVTGAVAFTFCNSEEERIKEVINSLKMKRDLSDSNDPWMGIVGFNAEQLREMLKTISEMLIAKDPILEGIEGKNITILQLNAPSSSTFTNIRTGLKIAALKIGKTAYPMHPTPAS